MKVHMSLSTKDVEKTTKFYKILFGEKPKKLKKDYVKFDPEIVALNISFHLVGESNEISNSQHLGFEFASKGELENTYKRLVRSGLVKDEKTESICCYANQDKFHIEDPSGYKWELYTLLADTDKKISENSTCCVGDDFENKSKCG